MARRLHPEERSLWNRVVETVKPLHPVKVILHAHPVEPPPAMAPVAAMPRIAALNARDSVVLAIRACTVLPSRFW